MSLREGEVRARKERVVNGPANDARRKFGWRGRGNRRRGDRNRIRAHGAAERLGRLLVRLALRQFAVRCAFAVTDFEEGPVLVRRLRGELRTGKSTEEKLEDERIGGDPAQRPAQPC